MKPRRKPAPLPPDASPELFSLDAARIRSPFSVPSPASADPAMLDGTARPCPLCGGVAFLAPSGLYNCEDGCP